MSREYDHGRNTDAEDQTPVHSAGMTVRGNVVTTQFKTPKKEHAMDTTRPSFTSTLRQPKFWLVTAFTTLLLAPVMFGGALLVGACAGYLACRRVNVAGMNRSVLFWAMAAALTAVFTPSVGLLTAGIASLLMSAVIWDNQPKHTTVVGNAA